MTTTTKAYLVWPADPEQAGAYQIGDRVVLQELIAERGEHGEITYRKVGEPKPSTVVEG